MLRTSVRIAGLSLTVFVMAGFAASVGQSTAVDDQQSFTHVAHIPADADANSIRFQGAKVVQLATAGNASATDSRYCKDLAFRDPGGSAYCGSAQSGAPVKAIEVTYSFSGQPLGSDEQAGQYFTFHVYFRPEEVPAEVRQAISDRKWNRAKTAAYFAVDTRRDAVSRTVVDGAKSRPCERTLADGNWIQRDSGCREEISYKAVAVPSDFVTVTVESLPSPAIQSSIRH